MRLFIAALLVALSYAQTEGFCVERKGCVLSDCAGANAPYCPCTCKPGTINSNSDHFQETFGDVSTGEVTDSGAGVTDVSDQAGSGSGGDVTTDVAPSAPVTFSVSRTGYVCEEQDYELMHLRIFPLTSVQQCAEAVAAQAACGITFWAGPATSSCGCVRMGYECAYNEGNDQQAGTNVYILSPGSKSAAPMPGAPMPMPGSMPGAMPGSMPGFPGAGNMFNPGTQQNQGVHPMLHPGIFADSKYEVPDAPEPEDLLPGLFAGMMQQQAQAGGAAQAPYTYPQQLSKASPHVGEPKAKTTSPLVWALCFVIPTFVGFFIGAIAFRKFSSNSDLRQRITV